MVIVVSIWKLFLFPDYFSLNLCSALTLLLNSCMAFVHSILRLKGPCSFEIVCCSSFHLFHLLRCFCLITSSSPGTPPLIPFPAHSTSFIWFYVAVSYGDGGDGTEEPCLWQPQSVNSRRLFLSEWGLVPLLSLLIPFRERSALVRNETLCSVASFQLGAVPNCAPKPTLIIFKVSN